MSGYLTETLSGSGPAVSAAALAAAIQAADFSNCAATVVGYGGMGRQYVKALRSLGVERIRVCSRSRERLAELDGAKGVRPLAGGFEHLEERLQSDELGIVAIPTLKLAAAARHLVSVGFRKLLIEKPVFFRSDDINQLAKEFDRLGVEAVCAYNRIAYPSFHEGRSCASREGGITSCTYTFTEMIKPDWPERFPREELSRWGIANSLHVIGMAHGLIGMPAQWSGYRSGSLSWHSAGSRFVGSGISEIGVPFSYHADWGSTGRWSVEIHTDTSSYQLCPLEKLFRRTSSLSEWEEVPIVAFAPEIKAGIVEQVAAMLDQEVCGWVPLVSLGQAAALTGYAERIFGYQQSFGYG